MKIGMTSLTLRNHSVEDVVRLAKEAGISCIEWGVSDGHVILCDKERADEIIKLSEEYGVEIASLGSYCRMENKEDCDMAVETAVLLKAPVIRIWAGTRSPAKCDDEYRKLIVENTVYMADKAKEHGIILGFEYHPFTLTENCDDAMWLIEAVNKENVRLYWQPDRALSAEENVRDRDRTRKASSGIMHIQNYVADVGYGMLSSIEDLLDAFYTDIKDESYKLMIEFVKDGSIENLNEDAKTLRKILY